MARITLKGSERIPLSGSHPAGPADPNERLQVTVLLRRRGSQAFRDRVDKLRAAANGSPEFLTREEFARQFGADPADISAIKSFAAQHGLTVVEERPHRRSVVLGGTVAQFEAAFGVKLQRFEHASGSYRGRVGSIEVPTELDGIVHAVLGLDNRPQAQPHFRLLNGPARKRHAAPAAFTPIQLASLYDYPKSDGQGQCVGIIELGGGFTQADLQDYFSKLGITATPNVTAVSVDGGANTPTGDANGPDGEVMLDIEVVGAVAPGANIAVYFAPNTDAGFLDAVTTAIHDTTNKPSVISISWGSAESNWTAQAMTAMDEAFQAAATLGVTICVASGDNGSSDGVSDGADHVDFPASSPFALACGGTSLKASGSKISSEVVWNDGAGGGAGGGGVSSFFPVPTWQSETTATNGSGAVPLKNRGVPDVSGDADPQTGYNVRIDGTDTVIGGTSAVAPLWAGLLARINQLAGKPVGYLNPQLYKNPQALRDITQGNNGDFQASPGWDACTGLGSPDGQKVAALFTGGS